MIDFDSFWAPLDEESRPGVSEAAIRDWEQTQGVLLPSLLRQAYLLRNGGYVRHTDVEILPLCDLVPPEDDFWRYEAIPGEEAPDHALVFRLGYDNGIGTQFLLNYNASGARGEPSFYAYHNDGTGAHRLADSVAEFLEEELRFSAHPHVDWNEWKEGWEIIAQEGRDILFAEGGQGRFEQVLVRSHSALVVFEKFDQPGCELLMRTELPAPLDASLAQIWPLGQPSSPTYSLHLQPQRTEEVVTQRSTRIDDGRWSNSTSRGVPMFAGFQSLDREKLVRLRERLCGAADRGNRSRLMASVLIPKPTAIGAALIPSDLTAFERIELLPKPDRAVATVLVARRGRAEWRQILAETPGKVDPALNAMAWHMIKKMDEAVARGLAEGAPDLPDDETTRRISAALWPGQPGSGTA